MNEHKKFFEKVIYNKNNESNINKSPSFAMNFSTATHKKMDSYIKRKIIKSITEKNRNYNTTNPNITIENNSYLEDFYSTNVVFSQNLQRTTAM